MAIPCVVVPNVRVIDIGLYIGEQSKVEIEPSGCIEYISIYLCEMLHILDKSYSEYLIGLYMDSNVYALGFNNCWSIGIYDMVF